MEWKSLEEFPDYMFSDTGIVKKGDSYPCVSLWNGYPSVLITNKFTKKRVAIHRTMAELFIGPRPSGQMVRHLDDDKENNNISNLVYGTMKENGRDAAINRKMSMGDEHYSRVSPEKVKRGGDSHFAKLTQAEVDEIRATENYYGCAKKLAKKYNVHYATISKIKRGLTWRNDLFK